MASKARTLYYDCRTYWIGPRHAVNETGEKRVALKPLVEDLADIVQGELPDVEGKPVMYVGSHINKNYYKSHDKSHDTEKLSDEDLKLIAESELVLIENVDGGWLNWEGRPEWSDTYLDLTEATVVEATR